jgi:hypothetical protein
VITLRDVAQLCAIELPKPPAKCYCPIRKHKRRDKTFRIYEYNGTQFWKCWSCDKPDQSGDPIKLYGLLTGQSYKEAAEDLRGRGYELPDRDGRYQRQQPVERHRVRPKHKTVPLDGPRGQFVRLDASRWQQLRRGTNGLVARFAAERGLDPDLLLAHDVVQVGDDAVGFGYRDPDTMLVCRVKVRCVSRKNFWIEPKGKALAPLYLVHQFASHLPDGNESVVIVEGEPDALALRQAGYSRVVSLPDGAQSAGRVDLLPLRWYRSWFIATDDDADGNEAWMALRERAWSNSITPLRVKWGRLSADEEVERYKDANDALRAGFGREEFDRCLQIAVRDFGVEQHPLPR